MKRENKIKIPLTTSEKLALFSFIFFIVIIFGMIIYNWGKDNIYTKSDYYRDNPKGNYEKWTKDQELLNDMKNNK